MRRLACLPVLALLAGCAGAPAAPESAAAPRVPLRGADCLDPTFARGWHEVASDEVLVDAGRRKYRITLAGRCLFGGGIALQFVGDPVSGRVCGDAGDRILTRDGSCWIDRIELIDAAAWRDAQNGAHGRVEAEAGSR